MTKINVSSHICCSNHTVMGRIEGDRIIIQIETPCEKFRGLTCLEFPLRKLPDNQSSLTLEMERQMDCSLECTRECALDCTRECLIPPAVLDVCSIEKELAETKLAKVLFPEFAESTTSEFQ